MDKISLVVTLFNEEDNVQPLLETIYSALRAFSYELILVDDGSTDGSWTVIEGLKAASGEQITGIRFRRNYGKSAALNTGFAAARGNVIITMDADLQDSPDEIPKLYAGITKDGFDLISGWKKVRHDPLTKNAAY